MLGQQGLCEHAGPAAPLCHNAHQMALPYEENKRWKQPLWQQKLSLGKLNFVETQNQSCPIRVTCTWWLPTEEMELWHLVPSPWIGPEV